MDFLGIVRMTSYRDVPSVASQNPIDLLASRI